MPHYADGTEAKVGDQVVGKLYNTEGKRAGTIVSITPGAEACNAQVQFTEVVPRDTAIASGAQVKDRAPRMSIKEDGGLPNYWRLIRGEMHGTSGEEFIAFDCVDYCATNELTKVGP